mgnify:CR=1 FL=1
MSFFCCLTRRGEIKRDASLTRVPNNIIFCGRASPLQPTARRGASLLLAPKSDQNALLFLDEFHKVGHRLLKVHAVPLKLAVFHCESDTFSCILGSNLHSFFPIIAVHKCAYTSA